MVAANVSLVVQTDINLDGDLTHITQVGFMCLEAVHLGVCGVGVNKFDSHGAQWVLRQHSQNVVECGVQVLLNLVLVHVLTNSGWHEWMVSHLSQILKIEVRFIYFQTK